MMKRAVSLIENSERVERYQEENGKKGKGWVWKVLSLMKQEKMSVD